MTSFSERYGYSGKVNVYTCNGDKVLSKKTETESFHSFKHFLRVGYTKIHSQITSSIYFTVGVFTTRFSIKC